MALYPGTSVRITFTFKNFDGEAADPTNISATVSVRSLSMVTTYVYGVASELVRQGVGIYRLDLVVTAPGEHVVIPTGTGALNAAGRLSFRVLDNPQ
jgi:hypothetical protein